MWRTIESGFTLLELLIAVAIMAIAVVPLFVTLNAAMQNWERGSSYQEAYQNARGAIDTIARDLSSLYFVPDDPATILVASQQYDDHPKWMTFTMSADVSVKKKSDLVRVLYFTLPSPDFSLRRGIIYQDQDKDPDLRFERSDEDGNFYFPIKTGGPETWDDPLSGFVRLTEPDDDNVKKYMDPRTHYPEKKDGDEVAPNIVDVRFGFTFTKDADLDEQYDTDASVLTERVFSYRPDVEMVDSSTRPYSGWCSLWNYYPNPADPEGVSPDNDFKRVDNTDASNPLPLSVGLPLAVEIEVKATNDSLQYSRWLAEQATSDVGTQKPAIATVKQTIWLTSKWMEP